MRFVQSNLIWKKNNKLKFFLTYLWGLMISIRGFSYSLTPVLFLSFFLSASEPLKFNLFTVFFVLDTVLSPTFAIACSASAYKLMYNKLEQIWRVREKREKVRDREHWFNNYTYKATRTVFCCRCPKVVAKIWLHVEVCNDDIQICCNDAFLSFECIISIHTSSESSKNYLLEVHFIYISTKCQI